MERGGDGQDELLGTAQVAYRFGVNPKTVSRWADAGNLTAIRTPGGHRRYRASEVEALLEQGVDRRADEDDRGR